MKNNIFTILLLTSVYNTHSSVENPSSNTLTRPQEKSFFDKISSGLKSLFPSKETVISPSQHYEIDQEQYPDFAKFVDENAYMPSIESSNVKAPAVTEQLKKEGLANKLKWYGNFEEFDTMAEAAQLDANLGADTRAVKKQRNTPENVFPEGSDISRITNAERIAEIIKKYKLKHVKAPKKYLGRANNKWQVFSEEIEAKRDQKISEEEMKEILLVAKETGYWNFLEDNLKRDKKTGKIVFTNTDNGSFGDKDRYETNIRFIPSSYLFDEKNSKAAKHLEPEKKDDLDAINASKISKKSKLSETNEKSEMGKDRVLRIRQQFNSHPSNSKYEINDRGAQNLLKKRESGEALTTWELEALVDWKLKK